MSQIKKVYPGDFGYVWPLLEQFKNSGLSGERWKAFFINHWESPEAHIGYVLVDGEKVVGFLGTLFSQRFINGERKTICNLSSWFVLPEYRNESILLFSDILRHKEYTITSFTSVPDAVRILKKLGFRQLDNSFYWYKKNFFKRPMRIKHSSGSSDFEKYLSEEEKRVHNDHLPFNAFPLFFHNETSHCYIIVRKKDILLRNLISNRFINYADYITRKLSRWSFMNKKRTVAHIHYISNLDFFNKNITRINNLLQNEFKISGITVDARHVSEKKSIFRFRSCPRNSLYRPGGIMPEYIDSAYSELFILDLK